MALPGTSPRRQRKKESKQEEKERKKEGTPTRTKLPPIIPSVWTIAQRDAATCCPWPIVHVAGGRLGDLQAFTAPLTKAGKRIWVHPDRIYGLGRDEEAIRYLTDQMRPEMFVTSSVAVAQSIKKAGQPLCLRLFLYDTQSLESGIHTATRFQPEVLCIMPAAIYPEVFREFAPLGVPLMTAGLIRRPEVRDHLMAKGVPLELGAPHLW